jgi:hypothetical protein
MEEKGSYVAQFNGTADSAYALVFQLAGNNSVVLKVQKEIMDENRTVLATTAGRGLLGLLEKDTEAYQLRAAELESRLEGELKSEPRNKELIRQLRDEKAQVEKILRQMVESKDRMQIRPASSIRQRIKQTMGSSGKVPIGKSMTILAAVLNLTMFVVHLGLGGVG